MLILGNRPAIRDQLILQARNINLDKIIPELVLNTVVEIPHRRVCCNVFSLFYNSTLNPSNHGERKSHTRTSIDDNEWKYLEFSAPFEPDSSCPNPDLTETALVQEISRRMETGSIESSPEELISQSSSVDTINTPFASYLPAVSDTLTGSWRAPKLRRNDIATRFGLDQTSQWKLSKEFARKHPYLDCSSGRHPTIKIKLHFWLTCTLIAVAAYDMISVQHAMEFEAGKS